MIRPTLAASLLVFAGLSALPACNGGTSTGSTGGGGSGASAYCNAISSYATRCNLTDPCTTNAVQQCSTIASSYSAAALAAIADCITGVACTDAGVSAA